MEAPITPKRSCVKFPRTTTHNFSLEFLKGATRARHSRADGAHPGRVGLNKQTGAALPFLFLRLTKQGGTIIN